MFSFVKISTEHFGQDALSRSKVFRTKLLAFLVIYTSAGFLPTITVIYAWFQQKGYWQMGSFVYHALSTRMPKIAVFFGMLFNEWHFSYVCGTFYFSFHISLAFMHTFKTTMVKTMEMDNKAGQRPLKLLQEQMLIYSKLRIVTTLYNDVYGKLYVPSLKAILGIMLVQSVFISVRLSGTGGTSGMLVTTFGIAGVVISIVVIPLFVGFMAMVNEYSKRFLGFLRKRGHGELGRRLVRSYRIEAVRSGGMYTIEKLTCLTVLGLISNLCGSVLISIKL